MLKAARLFVVLVATSRSWILTALAFFVLASLPLGDRGAGAEIAAGLFFAFLAAALSTIRLFGAVDGVDHQRMVATALGGADKAIRARVLGCLGVGAVAIALTAPLAVMSRSSGSALTTLGLTLVVAATGWLLGTGAGVLLLSLAPQLQLLCSILVFLAVIIFPPMQDALTKAGDGHFDTALVLLALSIAVLVIAQQISATLARYGTSGWWRKWLPGLR